MPRGGSTAPSAVLLGMTLASAALTFSHLFPSYTVCFGTTVSPQAAPQGHMENDISELMCAKNNQEKNQTILPGGWQAVVSVPGAALGRQVKGAGAAAEQWPVASHLVLVARIRWWSQGSSQGGNFYTKQVYVIISIGMGILRRLRYLFL